jgi:hypothetical protein
MTTGELRERIMSMMWHDQVPIERLELLKQGINIFKNPEKTLK